MEERYIKMRDGHKLFFRVWRPDSEVVATLHLLHGMAEHSLRYREFALSLTNLGIAVYAQDHRGHGLTKEEDEKGWFAESDGWMTIARDSYELDQVILEENEGVPHFLMGHSMGSFLARTVVTEHPDSFDGLIVMGSGADQGLLGIIGQKIAKHHVKKYGSKMPDHKMDKLAFGTYNKKIQNKRTPFDWLSRDEKEVDKYIADPLCGFVCSSQFYYDLIEGNRIANDPKRMERINKSMPMLIISGTGDPVGGYGRGIEHFYKLYKKAGIRDLTLNLIPQARHELLNETDKAETAAYLRTWLEERIRRYNA